MKNQLKKFFFFIITLLIPLLFFVIIESFLRLFNYADDLKLVQTVEENGIKYYQLNPAIGKKYFSKTPKSIIPQLYPQVFEFKKSANTIRIFLLGGSTMAGFPYELNARINSLLQDRLSIYYPDKKFEVINTGLSAINSFSVLDFVEELVDYEPDLFIFYMGHNEFYGAFGVGSMENIGKQPAVIRAYLTAKKLKLFVLLRRTIQKISRLIQHKSDVPPSRTLMAIMAEKKAIPFHSSDYLLTEKYFQENLEKIISFVKKKNCPLLVSTLVSNLKDQPPFVSIFSDTLSSTTKIKWDSLFFRAVQFYDTGDASRAKNLLDQIGTIDSIPAKLHFYSGKCWLALNDSIRAKSCFEKARDLDALRFRAPGEFNSIIKKQCEKYNIPVIQLEHIFCNFSKYNIIGNELIAEHLHPNFTGFFLMAKSFAQSVVENRYVNSSVQSLNFNDNYFRELSGVTILDEAIGDVTIQKLTSDWPYLKKASIINYANPDLKNKTESIVADYSKGKISWNQAHYDLAQFLSDRSDFSGAMQEYLSVVKVVPDNYFPYFKLGNLYFIQDKPDDAIRWYERSLRLNKAAFIHAKLATVYLNRGNITDAKAHLEKALDADKQTSPLSEVEKAHALYYLALCNIKMNELPNAKINLEHVLKINPNFSDARKLLTLLRSNKKIQLTF